ncbi:precorrin-4 C(11)-methyltransferase, partial [Escherichia coli]
VPAAVLDGHRAEQVVNTAELDLDAIVALLAAAHAKGQDVARVHSGDPSLYGAIGEQIRRLKTLGIPYEI